MKQPEIVCDAPSRIEPGRPIPVFIFIKDADRYPVEISEVVIHAIYDEGIERIARFPFGDLVIREPFWWDSINIVPEFSGLVRLMDNSTTASLLLAKRGTRPTDGPMTFSLRAGMVNVAGNDYWSVIETWSGWG